MPALSVLPTVLTHHSEPSDPLLLRWVFDTFESITGLGPTAVVVPIAGAIVAFPVVLGFLAFRARRRQ
jgi:hypothetical protein